MARKQDRTVSNAPPSDGQRKKKKNFTTKKLPRSTDTNTHTEACLKLHSLAKAFMTCRRRCNDTASMQRSYSSQHTGCENRTGTIYCADPIYTHEPSKITEHTVPVARSNIMVLKGLASRQHDQQSVHNASTVFRSCYVPPQECGPLHGAMLYLPDSLSSVAYATTCARIRPQAHAQ